MWANRDCQVAKSRNQVHPTNGTVSGAQPVACFFEACKADTHTFCAAPEHMGKVRQCSKGHKEKLHEDCKDKVTKMQIHEAKSDVGTYTLVVNAPALALEA